MSGPAFAECPPDKPALIFGLSGLEVTYGDLEARANQRAHALRELGLKAGDVLAICIQNSPEFFDVACAARRSGLVTVPISTQLTAAEVAFITADSGCKALVVSAGIDADKAKLRALRKGVALLGVGDAAAIGTSWDELRARQPSTAIEDAAEGREMLTPPARQGDRRASAITASAMYCVARLRLPRGRLEPRWFFSTSVVPGPYHQRPMLHCKIFMQA